MLKLINFTNYDDIMSKLFSYDKCEILQSSKIHKT